MKFLLTRTLLLIVDKFGVRLHRAPRDSHFERQNDAMILKPDTIKEQAQEVSKMVADVIAEKSIDQALQYHAQQLEELLKKVLAADTPSQAAEIVADELRTTEEQMQERQERMKV